MKVEDIFDKRTKNNRFIETYVNNNTEEKIIYKINIRKVKICKYIMNQRYQNLNKLKKIKICQDLNKYTEKELFTKNIILLNIYYTEIFSNTIKPNINELKILYYMKNKNS